jgi:hypothetical protein
VKASFSLNNSSIAYLIHGQYFRLDYNISNCLFCVFLYDNGESFFNRIYFKKNTGVFENVTNAYKPNLKILAVGKGINFFRFRLKINFINSKPLEIEVNPIKSPKVAQMNTKFKQPQFRLPQFQQNQSICIQIKNKSIMVNQHHDLDTLINESKNNKQ